MASIVIIEDEQRIRELLANALAERGDWTACDAYVEQHRGLKWPVIRVIRAGLKVRDQSREILESVLQEAILHEMPRIQQGIALLLSAKKDFAVDWERFLRPAEGQTSTAMVLPITLERFPFMLRGLSPQIQSVDAGLVGGGKVPGPGRVSGR